MGSSLTWASHAGSGLELPSGEEREEGPAAHLELRDEQVEVELALRVGLGRRDPDRAAAGTVQLEDEGESWREETRRAHTCGVGWKSWRREEEEVIGRRGWRGRGSIVELSLVLDATSSKSELLSELMRARDGALPLSPRSRHAPPSHRT